MRVGTKRLIKGFSKYRKYMEAKGRSRNHTAKVLGVIKKNMGSKKTRKEFKTDMSHRTGSY